LHGVSASTEAVEEAPETRRAHAWLPLTDGDAWFGDVPAVLTRVIAYVCMLSEARERDAVSQTRCHFRVTQPR